MSNDKTIRFSNGASIKVGGSDNVDEYRGYGDQEALKNQLSQAGDSKGKVEPQLASGITKHSDGRYYDSEGTEYWAGHFDDNRVGIDKLWATRLDDPYRAVAAANHDAAFDRAKVGYKLPGENALTVNAKFVADSAKVAATGVGQIINGLTTVAKFPIYVALGAGIGFFRYLWIEKK